MTKKPAQVFHFDLYGKRDDKYTFLSENSIKTIDWQELKPQMPELFFVPKDFEVKEKYDEGFIINELFNISSLGIQTHRDNFAIAIEKYEMQNRIKEFYNKEFSNDYIIKKYNLKETLEWKLEKKRNNILNDKLILKIDYRLFDTRFTYFSKDIIDRDRNTVMKNLFQENIAFIISKQQSSSNFRHIFLSKNIQESCLISLQTKEGGSSFPLYLYPENTTQQSLLDKVVRTPNLNLEIVNEISEKLGIPFVAEKPTTDNQQPSTAFAPIDLLDYIYAVLHSPNYREKYKEFLKIDFPRVPYPKDQKTFFDLVALGGQLRQIHLLESEVVEKYITQYSEDGSNVVVKPRLDMTGFENGLNLGNVYINETQYFANVPEIAWNFYIGGYQPAQKWLKDRKGRELNYEDILHYQKIIVALTETDRLMKEIDKINI